MSKKYSVKAEILKKVTHNDTLRFIFPVLNAHGLKDDDLIIEELIGVYLTDANKPDLKDSLLIRCNPSNTAGYSIVDAKITSLDDFRGDYDKGDSIVYILDISKYKDEINLIKQGKFSELPDSYKQLIVDFWGLKDLTDPLSGVLWKTEVGEKHFKQLSEEIQKLTSESELWPIPDMEYETL